MALELATLTNSSNTTDRRSSSGESTAAMSTLLKQQAGTLQEMCSWCSDTELLGAQRLKIETLVAVQVTGSILDIHNSYIR
jgi:hypothetical protein